MRRSIVDAGLPLAVAAVMTGAAAAVPFAATPSTGAFTLGPYTIWGVDGNTVSSADFAYNASKKTITVNTDKHFAVQNTDQTMATAGNEAGYLANPADVCFVIPAGRKAHMVMENLSIKGTAPIDISPGAELTIILDDGTANKLNSTSQSNAALRCPSGAALLIDDSVRNVTADGRHITPDNGLAPYDCTLANGKRISKNDLLLEFESPYPGTLYALCSTQSNAAAIGGGYNGVDPTNAANYCKGEAAGDMVFDGGVVIAKSGSNVAGSSQNSGSGIGGGFLGNGTGPEECITINGGRVTATGGYHGAGIGAGARGASGNIRINGGYVKSRGGDHSNGFGGGCNPSNSSKFQIVLTGGTLLPSCGNGGVEGRTLNDAGAPGLQVVITGGSLGNDQGASNFRFDGTAKNDKGESVRMIEVDLSSDVGTSAYPISKWQLLVDGVSYDYGAPAEFDKGHLYLWLPEKVILESEIAIDLTYLDTDHLDADGNPTPVNPEPFFRLPGDPDDNDRDNKLRRYEDFELSAEAEALLSKPYDGTPLAGYDLATNPIPTREPAGKSLNDPKFVTYRYQPYDARGGNPLGPEVDDAGKLPTDEGVAKFIMTSTQYSNDTQNGFSESYWGHRATGWCAITPVPSKVADVKATWADGSSIADPHLPSATLNIEVDVTSGDDTATTCKAPTGHVQLYVDGVPAGEPVEIEMGVNARVAAGADGREHAIVSWSFPAGSLMTSASSHVISAKYLPAINYLESATPGEKEPVPSDEIIVLPDPTVEPKPSTLKTVKNLTHPDGPTQAGDRLRYTIEASNSAAGSLWMSVVLVDALPACLTLDPSTLRLTNSWEEFDGKPLPGDGASLGTWALAAPGTNGRRTLSVGAGNIVGGHKTVLTFECTVDPTSVHEGATAEELDLTNVAEPIGTRPDPSDPDNPYSPMPDPDNPGNPIPVTPEPTPPVTPPGGGIALPADPEVRAGKWVENASAPDALTTSVGDMLRYEIGLENAGDPSSCLIGAIISDPLPKGIEYVPGTMTMMLPDGTAVPVSDAAYDEATRTVTVSAGDLWGGRRVTLSFAALVTAAALGENNANIAYVHGTIPSTGPDPQPTGSEPGLPADPPTGEPVAETPPAAPPIIVGDNDPDGPSAGPQAVDDDPGDPGDPGNVAPPGPDSPNGSGAVEKAPKSDNGDIISAVRTKLAQTGDTMWMLLAATGGSALGALLLIAAAALVRRRTRRTES